MVICETCSKVQLVEERINDCPTLVAIAVYHCVALIHTVMPVMQASEVQPTNPMCDVDLVWSFSEVKS